MAPPKFLTAWLVLRRADDVPGQWTAHCLDFDVVTQGNSMLHAIEMAYDAVGIVLSDDQVHSRDPYSRRAPQRFWDDFYEKFSSSVPVKGDLRQLNEGDVDTLLGQISIHVHCVREDHVDAKKIDCTLPIMLETTRGAPVSAQA